MCEQLMLYIEPHNATHRAHHGADLQVIPSGEHTSQPLYGAPTNLWLNRLLNAAPHKHTAPFSTSSKQNHISNRIQLSSQTSTETSSMDSLMFTAFLMCF